MIKNKKVNFNSTQLYIKERELVEKLDEYYEQLGCTNKSDFLRDLVEIGLEASIGKSISNAKTKDIELLKEKIDEYQLSLKENTDLIKDNVSILIKTIKQNDDHIDNQLGPITKNINLILTRLDKQEEFNKTVLVALANIYTMEYSKRFRYKLKENEIRNGEHDDFPNFFKERISNNHE